MATTRSAEVSSTDRTTNLNVAVTGDLSLDEMERRLLEAATGLGMEFSKTTTLGTKRYPGNRHWHLKRSPSERGCLDVTYWPAGSLMWISIRHYEPAWVHDLGHQLGPSLDRLLANDG
jgi:hypothetical protein